MRKLWLVIAGVFLAVALAPTAAFAKEGVKATLLTDIPLRALPGERLHLAWTLAATDGGKTQPFGANGVFVRLRSASWSGSELGFAPSAAHADGRYAAMVVVPDGGIGDVEIGLRGWTSGPSGIHFSDVIFPITNDPLPGRLRVAASTSSGSSKTWPVILLAVAAFAACSLALIATRWRTRVARAAANGR
jgi:hypothetical protein